MDAPNLITKRLHISGLTPSLTPADLSKRLSTFGTVKSLDGFGLPDGLGQPRKFGYVTIETTAPQLAKCLNLLSGSTWKGAKLRIGDAKPDYQERLTRERETAEEPPKKRRKRAGGVHAEDMSLVTPENVKDKAGWKVSALGRIVRPVRMRPERPLADVIEVGKDKGKGAVGKGKTGFGKVGQGKDEGKEDGKKKKKRERVPDGRARRRTIDPIKWGSVHLKGMFLDVVGSGKGVVVDDGEVHEVWSDESETSEGEEGGEEDNSMMVDEGGVKKMTETKPESTQPAEYIQPPKVFTSPLATLPAVVSAKTTLISLPDDNTDIALEKSKSLDLLNSLFGGKKEDEWLGRESVGSDVDEEDLMRGVLLVDEEGPGGGVEEVPIDVNTGGAPVAEEEEEDGEEVVVVEEEMEEVEQEQPPTEKQQQATKLKDLFAPREEQSGFSLLGHLDLDLELDDEILFPTIQDAEPSTFAAISTSTSAHTPFSSTPVGHTHLTLDPKQPLFFPLPSSFPSSSTSSTNNTKARSKDLFDVAREGGWNWRDPNVGFWRTGTEEDIRARWEGEKVELTKGWKKRWREAGKVRRRRGAGVGGDAE